jgi:hypothetical protein
MDKNAISHIARFYLENHSSAQDFDLVADAVAGVDQELAEEARNISALKRESERRQLNFLSLLSTRKSFPTN